MIAPHTTTNKIRYTILAIAVCAFALLALGGCFTNAHDSSVARSKADAARFNANARVAEAEAKSVSSLANANARMAVASTWGAMTSNLAFLAVVVGVVGGGGYMAFRYMERQQSQNAAFQTRLIDMRMEDQRHVNELEMIQYRAQLPRRRNHAELKQGHSQDGQVTEYQYPD